LPRIGYFCDEDKNLDKEAVFIKEGEIALAYQSRISMTKEDVDEYSLLYLQFVFSYCFNVILAYNTLVYHVY
jgi:hypothetical protein